MLRGFALLKDGSAERIESRLEMAAAMERGYTGIWIDLEDPDQETLNAIGDAFHLDAEALDDCLSGDQRPRIDEFEHCLFLLTYGAVGPESSEKFDPRKVSAFIGSDFVITVHPEPLRTINDVYQRCAKSPARMLTRGTNFILYAVLDGMVDRYIDVAEAFDDRLDALEEECFSEDVDESILQRASQLRRELLELRRIATSQRELILPIMRGDYGFLSKSLENDFGHVSDHIMKTIEMIDNQRELLHGVRDNYQAVLGNRMNAIMKTLTIFASLFLPLSLVAGIYGMNTPLWPDPGSMITFWGIIGFMGAAIVAMLFYFQHRGWL
jgi:magnesium transporter